jgi:hypothetical protein
MTTQPAETPRPEPYFHEPSGAVRFWVPVAAGGFIGASIPTAVLHFRFHSNASGTDAVADYRRHRGEIEDAVLRRVAQGSIEPVMLREADIVRPIAPRTS